MSWIAGAVAALLSVAGGAAEHPGARADLPDTTAGIHVFNDQLSGGLSPGLLRFAATHYAGSQKLPASQIDALKALNRNFFVLQYRLGIGLGFRAPRAGCRPTGDWIRILHGNTWKREWPARVQERWFSHRGGRRVLHCRWGWYLTNPDNTSWRARFTADLRREVAATHTDGVFLDSVSVPNYLGASEFSPRLPDVDRAFERAWSGRIRRFLGHVRARLGRPVIANVGWWVTTRDETDYSGIDGVMVEGFAFPGGSDRFAEGDWELQMGRVLSLVRRGRVVVGQTYPDPQDVSSRTFALASYLLVKGSRTFVNLEIGPEPEWFPEYELNIGRPVGGVPASIESLRVGDVYARRYERGIAVVNPGSAAAVYELPGPHLRVRPFGGGRVPESGVVGDAWGGFELVLASERVTLAPGTGALLLRRTP